MDERMVSGLLDDGTGSTDATRVFVRGVKQSLPGRGHWEWNVLLNVRTPTITIYIVNWCASFLSSFLVFSSVPLFVSSSLSFCICYIFSSQ